MIDNTINGKQTLNVEHIFSLLIATKSTHNPTNSFYLLTYTDRTMADDMDLEYTLNHADIDLQQVQAERDEEARLVFLALDELDLILTQ